MISKTNPVNSAVQNPNIKRTQPQHKTTNVQKTTEVTTKPELPGSEFAGSYIGQLEAGCSVSHAKSKHALSELEESIIGEKEIRIPNILDLDEDIHLSLLKMPQDTQHLNSKGLNVTVKKEGNEETYNIYNNSGDNIFAAKVDRAKAEELPVITYKQGKFMPEITVKDPSLDGKSIKMLAGSELKGDGFDFRMVGDYKVPDDNIKKQVPVSFKGRTVISTKNKEPRTLEAVNLYRESGLTDKTVKGDYYDLVKEDDPTIVIPAGGFGERFYNITREKENKPSELLPTDSRYRIIATPLNMASAAGIINGDETDSVKYLSQAHEIPENDDTYYVASYKDDGGAVSEGLFRNIVPNDKPIIVLNADIFTNADITRTYKELKTLPNAALVIPYYPVNSERAKSFGLLGIQEDEEGNFQVKKFIEKPKYTEPPLGNSGFASGEYDKAMKEFLDIQIALNPEDESTYLANPGFYFLSPTAAKVLMAQGIMDPSKTGLGAAVMPKIVEMANNGQLLDEDGTELKVYTVPLEAQGGKRAVWDDIGTAEAYMNLIRDVACEFDKHGNTEENKYYGVPEFVMEDFYDNTDLDTGIVYMNQEAQTALDNFKKKYNVEIAEGNMLVK